MYYLCIFTIPIHIDIFHDIIPYLFISFSFINKEFAEHFDLSLAHSNFNLCFHLIQEMRSNK